MMPEYLNRKRKMQSIITLYTKPNVLMFLITQRFISFENISVNVVGVTAMLSGFIEIQN